MPDPVSHGQMMNYLVRNSEDKKRMREYFETNQITTASNINKPREPKLTQMFEDFNFRNKLAGGGMLVQPSADGSRPGYAKPKALRAAGDKSSRPKPALDRFSDLLVKANANDDIQFLLPKTKSNPSGKATNQDIFNFKTDFVLREEKMQYLSKKSGLSIDEIFDLVEDADAYKELEGASISQTLAQKTRSAKDRPRTARQEFYKKAEQWFLQNAKRYDDPEKFKKAFNRTFGKNNILSKDLKKTYSFFVPFSPEFKREFFGTGLGMTQGGKKSRLGKPITDPKKLANIFYKSTVLDSVFKTTLYNLNPKVRNKITEEFKKIIPSTGATSIERYEASQALKNNKLLKKFNLDRSIKGPISRLIFKELGEDLYNDISSLRNPKMRTTSLIRFLSTKVDKKYQPMFKEAVTAIERAQKSEWPAAKQSLKIASDIMFDHKIPTTLIEKGYADEINYIKASPTPGEFNAKIKNIEFDRPISKLATKYSLEKNPVEKKKLFKEMQDLKNNFSSKYGGYLDTLKIKDVGGKPFFESTEIPISKSTDFTKELTRTQNQLLENLKTSKAGAEAGFVDLDLFKDIGKGADRFLFRPLTAIEAPTLAIPQSAYAASKLASDVAKGQETDTSALDITLPTAVSSLAASKKFGLDLFADNAGKVKRFLRGPFTQSGVRALSRGSLFATPFIETAIQGYNARQALLKAREKYGTDDMVPTAVGMAPKEYVRDLAIENQKFEGEGLTPFSAAGGGIAKLAGDPSGPPPKSGPNSQGLSGLLKRANKI